MRPRQDRTTPEDRSVRNAPLVALSILQPKASEGALCFCSVMLCFINILIKFLDLDHGQFPTLPGSARVSPCFSDCPVYI